MQQWLTRRASQVLTTLPSALLKFTRFFLKKVVSVGAPLQVMERTVMPRHVKLITKRTQQSVNSTYTKP